MTISMAQQRNQLRIIGGQWRGRKLGFPSVEGLRPTPDRVRETVFNWLMPVIQGARCLDLFAGSGALGLEALSRGAAEVVMVDSHPQVIKQLQQHLDMLKTRQAQLVLANAIEFLERPASAFDVVFLDPPYDAELVPVCIDHLSRPGWLNDNAYIYIEMASEQTLPALPDDWTLYRRKRAHQVAYHLAHYAR